VKWRNATSHHHHDAKTANLTNVTCNKLIKTVLISVKKL